MIGNRVRRISIFAILAFILISSVSASIIQIGPTFSYNKSELDKALENKELSTNLGFGGDFRLNILYFQLAAQAGIGGVVDSDDKAITFNTNVTANAHFTASFVELLLGVGANMDFAYLHDSKEWKLNGVDYSSFKDALGKSTLIYRAALGINISRIGLSFQVIVPTDGTFSDSFTLYPNFDESKFIASVLFNFF